MDHHDAKIETVLSWLSARQNWDHDAFVELTDPAVEVRLPEALPWGGTYKGKEELRRLLEESAKRFSRYEAVCEEKRAIGDHVVLSGWLEVTAAHSGEQASISFATFAKVRDGLIVSAHEFTDAEALTRLVESPLSTRTN